MVNAYKPGEIFQIRSYSDHIRDYQEAMQELQRLSGTDGAMLSSIGKTKGYHGYHNPLDILVVDFPATKESRHAVYVVGGAHMFEEASSETAIDLVRNLVQSANNPNLKRIREHTHIFVLPQLNSDYFNHLNHFWGLKKLSSDDPLCQLYDPYVNGIPLRCAFELILKEDGKNWPVLTKEFVSKIGSEIEYDIITPEAQSLVKAVEARIQKYGPPVIAISLHEASFGGVGSIVYDYRMRPIDFLMKEIQRQGFGVYMGKKDEDGNFLFNEKMTYNETTFFKVKGAKFSVLTETSHKRDLDERVRVNLVVIERLLHKLL